MTTMIILVITNVQCVLELAENQADDFGPGLADEFHLSSQPQNRKSRQVRRSLQTCNKASFVPF